MVFLGEEIVRMVIKLRCSKEDIIELALFIYYTYNAQK